MSRNPDDNQQATTRWMLMAAILIPVTAFVVLRWPQIRDRFLAQPDAEESSLTATTEDDISTTASPDANRENVVQ